MKNRREITAVGGPHRRLTAAWTVPLLLLAAACVPGTNGSAGTTPGDAAATSLPDPANAGTVTLTVWDQQVRGGQNSAVERLNKEFEKKYPNVTIKRVARSFNDLKKTLKLALSGDNPPDVVQANQGHSDMVAFANAGMLAPLDTYAGLYGWNTRFPQTLLNLNRVSADGSKFGTGRLYGVSQEGEYIGIYYNKDVLRRANVEQPKTWEGFTAALAQLKKAGQLPVQFGNLDKYPAIHTFGVLQSQEAKSAQPVRDTVLGSGAGFGEETRGAARTFADWANKGYVPRGANGKGYDDAAKQFADGKGAFLITGTWLLADLRKSMGDNLGFMPPPPAAGRQLVTTGGEGLPWSITSKSDHPDVAAAYLDFLSGVHASEVMMQEGVLPVVPPTGSERKAGSETAADQVVKGWQDLNAADGLVPYLDLTTPTFYDTLSADLQNLISGDLPPGQFVERMQMEYDDFSAQQREDEGGAE
ncbi:ABC transporter substrate-binding protein [Streptomyces sp. NPDC091290]|uniref:ABC transporter substrate-binding protein n=1 Tax=Streptomyces sp. NPDC091290 TaxID=3365990 RepID=UPI00381DC6B4